jgi:NAD(P)-dependent dehydrogenase (short-subunit alcohol dehydrogenase family)
MDQPFYSNARKAIITGGSSGIGKSLVNKFCKENIKTAFADIVVPQEKIEGSLYFKTNIADPDQVQNLIDNINYKIGTPDIIICNAGRGIHQFLKDGNPELCY